MKTAAIIDIRRHLPQSWEEALSRFLTLRKSQGAAPRRLAGYKEFIEQFFRSIPLA